ncbi:MAG: 2-amino-4-hydroxy-6-hydroxymethyldihydropteridine diphosphokinase [Hyphomonadaceae bacterium]|nr:2-amino-4-hydroxy-6-hydroxymethyldihydropteridine diphosphokinase [Hyphomonadaceae bacterium]MBC6412411.1 2-amino-4-hydroxy-6-hydroxymethyldihydropteridine diphosphokinase [Hyphomonadaceae bacterium]
MNQSNSYSTYIGLGANLSNPELTFARALADLKKAGVGILTVSSLWKSPAWPPGTAAPDYLNMVIKAAYNGTPHDLLQTLERIEAGHGRVRSKKNAPRTLDLDIVDFQGQVLDAVDLTLPHPRMLSREFVLFPLAEVAPDWVDPRSGRSIWYFVGALATQTVDNLSCAGRLMCD